MHASKPLAAALSALFMSSCASSGVADALIDVAAVTGEASELKDCRALYQASGDAFALTDCERDAVRGW